MQALGPFVAEMRALGIKSLTLELERDAAPPVVASQPETEAEPPEQKAAGLCAARGCSEPHGGVFGVATEFCERHALGQAGVR